MSKGRVFHLQLDEALLSVARTGCETDDEREKAEANFIASEVRRAWVTGTKQISVEII